MQDVRLIGRYEAISLAGFLVLSMGIMCAFRQIWGQFALRHDSLKMSSMALRVNGPNTLMKLRDFVGLCCTLFSHEFFGLA